MEGTTEKEGRLQRLAALGADAERLRNSEDWLAWLSTVKKFHRYSAANCLLIMTQRPDATLVAGYKRWQSMGRQVRRGEKGIQIFGPMFGKKGTEDEGKLVGFRVLRVFDVSQTDGEVLPDQPAWPILDIDVSDGLFDQVATRVRQSGLLVEVGPMPPHLSAARGFFALAANTIQIAEGYPESQQVLTLLHELGHAFDEGLRAGPGSREGNELVAESVAFLLAERMGLDGARDEVVHYLASWEGSTVALMELAERIIKTTQAVEAACFRSEEELSVQSKPSERPRVAA